MRLNLCMMNERDSRNYEEVFHTMASPKISWFKPSKMGGMRSIRNTIDAVTGGSLMRKTIDGAFDILEEMANTDCLWPSERHSAPR